MGTAAVILAAGAGTRFVGAAHKLLSPHPADPTRTVLGSVVGAALDAQLGGALDEVIVVWGAVDVAEVVGRAVAARPPRRTPVLVENRGWADGQAGSVHVGMEAAASHGHRTVVVCPGDQVGVDADTFAAVARCPAPLAAAAYVPFVDEPRPPVRLEQHWWDHVPRHGDEGARGLFRSARASLELVVVPGTPTDIDTVEDLERWN